MQSIVEVQVERAVAGGHMLGRVDGMVVLVGGAIPGERIRAKIVRSTAHVAWAQTTEVLESSPDRRSCDVDPACGGLAYAHIRYERQCALKGEVIADAFRRVGKMTLDAPVTVRASGEQGYRLRARLHVREGRFGFFREHSHELCDAGQTAQLRPEALAAVRALLDGLGEHGTRTEAVIVGENIAGDERVLHLETQEATPFDAEHVARAMPAGVAGVSTWANGRPVRLCGNDRLHDRAADLFAGVDSMSAPPAAVWSRSAASFFQANRFLVGPLVAHVLGALRGDVVADLYAGVGLFAVATAASGRRVLAVEGDRTSAADLAVNAEPYPQFEAHCGSVEHAARRLRPGAFDTIVVDPPRTGLSKQALDAVLPLAAGRLVYVSCDPATLARDAARLVASGYQLQGIEGFDMFPSTGHVETVAVFDRQGTR